MQFGRNEDLNGQKWIAGFDGRFATQRRSSYLFENIIDF